ncbi:MAG: host attachment protein [Deltaproteobacteria bacterium]|nr:host attachment protein [Deltaproteobacteria bacterium]
MTTSWIVVAHRAGARIFEHGGPGQPLARKDVLDHPRGRAQDREIDADRPGRTRAPGASQRHAMEPRETPHEHDAHAFAKEIAKRLTHARGQGELDRLVLVAEPHFLGYLDAELDAPTQRLVTHRVHKDLAHVSDADIDQHLGGALPTA